jgi:urea transport system ATP-binding protein
MAIILVEQYLDFARELGDRFVVMDRGSIVYSAWKDAVDETALKKAMAL